MIIGERNGEIWKRSEDGGKTVIEPISKQGLPSLITTLQTPTKIEKSDKWKQEEVPTRMCRSLIHSNNFVANWKLLPTN